MNIFAKANALKNVCLANNFIKKQDLIIDAVMLDTSLRNFKKSQAQLTVAIRH